MNTQYRQRIIDAAYLIAKEKGVQNIQMRAVAAKGDVALGTIYQYFPSKNDLMIEVIAQLWREALQYEKFIHLQKASYVDFVNDVYHTMITAIDAFDYDWLGALSAMPEEVRVRGRQYEYNYFTTIKKQMLDTLLQDQRIDSLLWQEHFTPQMLVNFTWDCLMTLLRNHQEDCAYLLCILRKVLYKE